MDSIGSIRFQFNSFNWSCVAFVLMIFMDFQSPDDLVNFLLFAFCFLLRFSSFYFLQGVALDLVKYRREVSRNFYFIPANES